ncbi:hypothetical protein [Bacillus tuaregi]|uniref:hypothetical protein n=1 Tax=Bacillus tuaregi TaxID=1816695 RepID=UPI0008F89D2B|nr:hypothetical protein [Bacillus tuaregi]
MLKEIEKKLIDHVFDMSVKGGEKLSLEQFELAEKDNPDYRVKWSELGSYLLNLRSQDYLRFDDSILTCGGEVNQKYDNNISFVWTDKLELGHNGITFILDELKAVKDKEIQALLAAGQSTRSKWTNALIFFVLGLIVAWMIRFFN